MSRSLWRFYLRSYRGSLGEILISVAAAIAQSLLLLPMAWLVGYAFDTVLPGKDVGQIAQVGLAIVALQGVNLGVQTWARRRIVQVTKRATERLRLSLLARVFTVSRKFHSEQDWGQLHALFVHDTDRIDRFNENIIGSLLPSLITAAAICVMLVALNPLLFFVLALSAPLLLLVSKGISNQMRAQITATERATKRFAQGTRFLLEMMDLIRIQTAEVQETERQRANIADLRAQGVRVQTLRALNAGANETVIVVASVAILIVGGRAVAQDAMTVGQLLSFYTGLVLVRPYFQNIALSWPYWIEGRLALQSLAELEDTQIDAPYTGAAPLDFQGEIRLEGVQFHYQDAPTLHDITFTLPRGGLIGLIGPNGSGKSTIVNLILGFYRPQAGRLLADGQPYADLDLLALRRQMAVVMQAPILFPGTVWDNLVYGLPQATGAEVYAAAQEAGAHALILGLPQGYQTLVGEKGLLLSGGQRQRIALTRALLRQPRLLILDEPTNHLDADAVLDLLDLLTRRPARPTTLVISHDLRLARCMDQLVLLDGGGVVAAGAAAEVLPSLAASGKLQKSGS